MLEATNKLAVEFIGDKAEEMSQADLTNMHCTEIDGPTAT